MPIAAGDIDFHLSGGSGNTDPDASLGGIRATAQIANASLHNLFDIVSSQEANDGDNEYRCMYVRNNHGTLAMQNTVIWIQTETGSSDTNIDIALAGEGLNATAETIADESTAPAGESFTHPTTEGAGLSLGNIPAGQHYAVWTKRVVGAAASAVNADTAILRVKCDTAA